MRIRLLMLLCVVLAALTAAGRAAACSHDDTAYFETFLDTSCLQAPLSNTTLDALGGLRLVTNGVPSTTAWDTDGDFVNGVNFQAMLFPSVGVSTLAVSGTGAAAALTSAIRCSRERPLRLTKTASTGPMSSTTR